MTGATICMVTHDPRYARHAERHIHLFDGRVVAEPTDGRADWPPRGLLRATARAPARRDHERCRSC